MDEMMMLLVPEDIAAEVLFRHGQQNHIAYMAFPGTHIMGLFGTKGTEHGRFALRERTDTRTDDLLKQAVDSMRPVICRLSDVTGIPNAIPIYIVSNEGESYAKSGDTWYDTSKSETSAVFGKTGTLNNACIKVLMR